MCSRSPTASTAPSITSTDWSKTEATWLTRVTLQADSQRHTENSGDYSLRLLGYTADDRRRTEKSLWMTHNLVLSGCASVSPTQKAFVTFWVRSGMNNYINLCISCVLVFSFLYPVVWVKRYGFVTLFRCLFNLVDVLNQHWCVFERTSLIKSYCHSTWKLLFSHWTTFQRLCPWYFLMFSGFNFNERTLKGTVLFMRNYLPYNAHGAVPVCDLQSCILNTKNIIFL